MFTRTRLQLTAWYLSIIMVVSLSFSVFIYGMLSQEVERFVHMQQLRTMRQLRQNLFIPDTVPTFSMTADTDLIAESKQRIIFILGIVNSIVLFFSGGLGYFLAGRTLQPIQTMVDEQNRFVSDASHELRTPITSLKSAMEVALRDKNLSLSDAKHLIEENISETNKLQQLTEQMLQFSQFQGVKKQTVFGPINTKNILTEVIRKMKPLAKKKEITIHDAFISSFIFGNKDELVNLFVILLDNAIKYSQQKSIVTLATHTTNNSVFITVQDQGIGISRKDLPYIFQRFYRADQARCKTQEGGFGLGLSIAKKIVTLHKGRILVESTLGKGSLFTIELPIYKKTNQKT